MNINLHDAFMSKVNIAAAPALWVFLSIAVGALLGVLVSKLIFSVTRKTTIDSICSGFLNYTLIKAKQVDASDQPQDDERTKEILDDVGNTIASIGSDFSFSYIYILIVFSGCMCYVLFDWIGAVSFVISFFIYALLALELEERRFILSRIEEIVVETNNNTKEAKKIARRFYKTFKTWVEPGRTKEEFFRDANAILKEYMDQINP